MKNVRYIILFKDGSRKAFVHTGQDGDIESLVMSQEAISEGKEFDSCTRAQDPGFTLRTELEPSNSFHIQHDSPLAALQEWIVSTQSEQAQNNRYFALARFCGAMARSLHLAGGDLSWVDDEQIRNWVNHNGRYNRPIVPDDALKLIYKHYSQKIPGVNPAMTLFLRHAEVMAAIGLAGIHLKQRRCQCLEGWHIMQTQSE